jgi:hypothetical protein
VNGFPQPSRFEKHRAKPRRASGFIRNAEKAKKSPAANPEPGVEQKVRTKSKRSGMGAQASTMVLNPPQAVRLYSKGTEKTYSSMY